MNGALLFFLLLSALGVAEAIGAGLLVRRDGYRRLPARRHP
jgi:hypothetical protein